MAHTYNTHTGDNSTTVFPFTFPYLDQDHVKVYVDEVLKTYVTDWTFASATQVQFVTAPATSANIRIARETDATSPEATFYAGSSVRHTDLNDNQSQVLYSVEEIRENIWDKTLDTISSTETWVSSDDKVATTAGTDGRIDSKIDTALTTDIIGGTDLAVIDNTPGSGQITINHNVAGANTTVNNADGNVLQDITVSAQGHVTSVGSTNLDTRYYTETELDGGQLDTRYYTETELDGGQLDTRYYTETELDGGQLDARYYTEAELDAGQLDNRYFTETESDARYFRQDSSETISSGDTWTGSDAFVATTGAIDARIIDLVDEVGGFVPIANETSFPATNPDINDGAGTIVSILEIQTTRTPAAGTVTIANGQGSNTVTINNCGTTELTAGYGVLVETTATLNTYNFHRLVPKATEVTTVASNITNINNVAASIADVANFADVYQIAASNPTTRADGSALSEGDLYYNTSLDVIRAYNGTSYDNITPDQTQLADIQVVANDLCTFTDLGLVSDPLTAAQSGGALETCADNMADINALADIEDGTTATDAISDVAAIAADVTAVAGNATNINTVAGNNANVTTVANNDANVTTVAGISSNVTTVAGISADVTTVAGISANVTTVANNNTDVSTVAGIATDIANLADIEDGTVATDAISNVNTIRADVTTVASNNTNVSTVAGSIANVNTVAGSIADVNRYAAEYTISASAPGSPSAGDLWYDSSASVLKYYNGSAFTGITPGLTDIVLDTTPQLGGTLDGQNNNLSNIGTIDGTNLQIDFGTI